MPNLSEIQYLIHQIEARDQKHYTVPSDFEDLSVQIFKKTKENISISTLKRLWGYIPRREQVRKSTLDILAKYIGYTDFQSFCINRTAEIMSGFLSTEVISSRTLAVGTQIQIGWFPDRLCELEYRGKSIYKVVKSENARIKQDDLLRTSLITLHQPLIVEILTEQETIKNNYIAGKSTGLTILNILSKNE